MFAGPIIAREVLTAPRPLRFYALRASYAGLFFVLMWTAWQLFIGWDEGPTVGVLARFGATLFALFAVLQLVLMLFFAPLAAATAVAHEKDRRTFVLLLMTDLSDTEIVIGKLVASLIQVLALLLTSAPVFALCVLLGGVAPGQVADVFAVTAAAGLAGGSLGLIVALGRDRTFQSLALTVLLVTLALIAVEVVSYLAPEAALLGVPLAAALSPFRAIVAALVPDPSRTGLLAGSTWAFLAVYAAGSLVLNAASVVLLRRWNPGRNEPREQREGAAAEGEALVESLVEVAEVAVPALAGVGAVGTSHGPPDRGRPLPDGATTADDLGSLAVAMTAARITPAAGDDDPGATTGLHVPRRTHRRLARAAESYRKPWTNPILWRELRTRAYGTKPLIIKGAYLLAFALGVGMFYASPDAWTDPWAGPKAMIPPLLAILSLILVNAQGVTALTSERDTGALDLLLVTELSPKQFIYGKLYGVLYNAKEMIALPLLLVGWFAISGAMPIESAIFTVIDFLLLAHFSAMLGLHAAITYTNSRTAVAHSLGTIFFLMVGILICAYLIIISTQEFGRQLLSFLIFIGAGSVALYGSLGARNPSAAIGLVALLTPFWSFYCVISLVHGDFLAAFLFSVGIYGFALLAMLVPAVSDFDIALGRTNAIQG